MATNVTNLMIHSERINRCEHQIMGKFMENRLLNSKLLFIETIQNPYEIKLILFCNMENNNNNE